MALNGRFLKDEEDFKQVCGPFPQGLETEEHTDTHRLDKQLSPFLAARSKQLEAA